MFPPIYQYHNIFFNFMIHNSLYLAIFSQIDPTTALYRHGCFLKLLLELIKGFIMFFNETQYRPCRLVVSIW